MVQERLEDAGTHWVSRGKNEGTLIRPRPFLVAAFATRYVHVVPEVLQCPFEHAMSRDPLRHFVVGATRRIAEPSRGELNEVGAAK